MKKRKLVNWEKPQKNPRMGWKHWFAEAAWECAALLLLIFAAVSMLSKLNPRDGVSGSHAFWMVLSVIFAVLLREGGLYGILCLSKDGKRETLIWLLCRLMPVLVVIPLFLRAWSRHAEEIRDGLLAVAVDVITAYNVAFHRNIAVSGGNEAWISAALQFTILGVFFLLLLSPGIGKRKWQFVLLPAATTALLMYLGLAPEWKEILWMLAGILMVHCSRRAGGIRPGKAVAVALCLAGISLLGLAMGASAARLLERSEETKLFEKELETNLKNLSTFSFSFGRATVSNKAPKYRDKKIMTVRMDQKPQTNLYFQEVGAAEYDHGEWTSPSNEFSAFCAENGFDEKWAAELLSSSLFQSINLELYQYELEWAYYGERQEKDYAVTQYQVKYHRFRNPFMLLPYGVNTEKTEGIRFDGKAIARKDPGRKTISFEGWNGNELEQNSLIYDWSGRNMERGSKEKAFWEKYNEFAQEHYLSYPDYIKTLDSYPYYRAVMDAENSSYKRVEYVILDKDAMDSLWEFVDENGALQGFDADRLNEIMVPVEYNEMSNTGRVQVTLNLSSIMTGANSVYSWALDELGPDQDPVEYFLRNRRKGYCTHYASAAVFLLRSVGIPARFASGYMLKPSAFVEQSDRSYAAEVIDRNGHAWVEIYLNDVGWIPVEMTPGYGADQTTMPTDKDMEELRRAQEKREEAQATPSPTPEVTPSPTPEATAKPEATATPKETKAPKNPERKEGKNSEGTDTKVYAWIAAAVLALAILFVILERRRAAKRRLRMALKRKYYKAAVVMMNRRVYRRLRKKSKIRKRNLTDRDFEEMLISAFGEENRSRIAEYMRVVKAAAFSDGKLSKEDCKLVWRIYKTVT